MNCTLKGMKVFACSIGTGNIQCTHSLDYPLGLAGPTLQQSGALMVILKQVQNWLAEGGQKPVVSGGGRRKRNSYSQGNMETSCCCSIKYCSVLEKSSACFLMSQNTPPPWISRPFQVGLSKPLRSICLKQQLDKEASSSIKSLVSQERLSCKGAVLTLWFRRQRGEARGRKYSCVAAAAEKDRMINQVFIPPSFLFTSLLKDQVHYLKIHCLAVL